MFVHTLNPIALQLGPFTIRYYGILFVAGILLGYWILRKLAKEKGILPETIEEYFLFLILGIVIGARLFHVIVYQAPYYFADPVRVLYIWKGGLASHGGVLGAILVTWWFCKRKQLKMMELLDLIALPIAVAAIFIRLGNFINGELVGRITSVPWAVQFPGYDGFRHPSQLYEALKNVMVAGLVWRIRLLQGLPSGFVFWSLVFLHSFFRFFVEFFKEFQPPIPPILGLTMGQVISLILIVVSGTILWRLFNRIKKGEN